MRTKRKKPLATRAADAVGLAYVRAVYVFLLASYILVLMYMASHPAQPTPQTPQSPKAATPIRGPA